MIEYNGQEYYCDICGFEDTEEVIECPRCKQSSKKGE